MLRFPFCKIRKKLLDRTIRTFFRNGLLELLSIDLDSKTHLKNFVGIKEDGHMNSFSDE